MHSKSMATRLITSSSASAKIRDLPLLTLTRVSNCSSWLRRSKSSTDAGAGTYCCKCDSRRNRSRVEIGCAVALTASVDERLPRTLNSNACNAANASWTLSSIGKQTGAAPSSVDSTGTLMSGRSAVRRTGAGIRSGNTPVASSSWLASA
ncbi:hypothetical protein D3C81_1368420 [compost metagenome]